MVSGASNALVMHSVVLLWDVVVRCLSIQCDLEEEVTSAGSIFTSGARLIMVPVCLRCAVGAQCDLVAHRYEVFVMDEKTLTQGVRLLGNV